MKPKAGNKSEFARKLARLRREDKSTNPSQRPSEANQDPESETKPRVSAPSKSVPIWVRKRLQASARRQSPASAPPSSDVPRLSGRPEDLQCPDDNSYWFRSRLYPISYVHGDWPLDRALGVTNDNFELLSGDEALRGLDSASAVYLDTETTGLSGGAGVFVYMVGLATFTEHGLEVWQGFMDGPEQEAALLQEVADRISRSGGVVSFFGKSFDKHRLQDKMNVHGIASPFEGLPHLDLYHPLRRLHRGVYENSRLQTMEKALCGLQRSDDLPGSLAPEAWFDYLGKRPHRLEGVFRHNCDDVLSLVTLLAWLAKVDVRVPGESTLLEESARELALCEALFQNKQFEQVLVRSIPFLYRHGLRANEEGIPNVASPETQRLWWLQAETQRRLRRGEQALASLQPLMQNPEPGIHRVRAHVLAAKVAEHESRDAQEALRLCLLALEDLGKLRSFQGRRALESEASKRAKRLTAKLQKATPS